MQNKHLPSYLRERKEAPQSNPRASESRLFSFSKMQNTESLPWPPENLPRTPAGVPHQVLEQALTVRAQPRYPREENHAQELLHVQLQLRDSITWMEMDFFKQMCIMRITKEIKLSWKQNSTEEKRKKKNHNNIHVAVSTVLPRLCVLLLTSN